MKKSIFNLASANKIKLIIIGMVLLTSGLSAQVNTTGNNGTIPSWCPAGNTEAHYYFIPEIQAYYDIQSSMFIYHEKNKWVHTANLPERFKNYDLVNGYKIAITGSISFDIHKGKYAKVDYAKANYSKNQKNNVEVPVIDTQSDKLAQLVF